MEGGYTRAVIYCRVSSERQVTDGNGLESQEYRCRQYAESLGLIVEHVFRDEGISGGLFDRPAMQALIAHLDSHWDQRYFVIFDDLKRFARDVEVHRRLKAELRIRQAKLHCLNYTFDDSAEGEFVETIFAAQNELERKQNRRQVCQKMKARVERGYWCFIQPAGYRYERQKEHGKLLTPVQPIADILAEALTAFANDRLLGQVDFLKFLQAKRFHELTGQSLKQLSFQYVKGLLTQPLYAGIVTYEPWGITQRKGQHQAIISEETFAKIQQKLARSEPKQYKKDRREFPLRRIISCSTCGHKLTGSTSRGRSRTYDHYTCNNKECQAAPKNITPDKLEAEYVLLLEQVKVDPAVIEAARQIVLGVWKQEIDNKHARILVQADARKDLERRIKEYVDLIPSTPSTTVRTRYEAKIDELDAEMKALTNEQSTEKTPDVEEALSLAFQFLGSPAKAWLKSDTQKKLLLHKMIFEENPVYSVMSGFGSVKLTLPFQLPEAVMAFQSTMVDPRGVEPLSERQSK